MSAANRLAEILRPYVTSLDRDLWTFRYESPDSYNASHPVNPEFHPLTVAELSPHIANWANRFRDPQIISGADTGHGL